MASLRSSLLDNPAFQHKICGMHRSEHFKTLCFYLLDRSCSSSIGSRVILAAENASKTPDVVVRVCFADLFHEWYRCPPDDSPAAVANPAVWVLLMSDPELDVDSKMLTFVNTKQLSHQQCEDVFAALYKRDFTV